MDKVPLKFENCKKPLNGVLNVPVNELHAPIPFKLDGVEKVTKGDTGGLIVEIGWWILSSEE